MFQQDLYQLIDLQEMNRRDVVFCHTAQPECEL
jgi:hypothetical protein